MKAKVVAVVAVVGFALLCLQVQPTSGQVKVGAFNIKNLGMTRLQRSWLTDVIVKVLCQYDVVFVQEMLTHQKTDGPVTFLWEALNAFARDNPCKHSRYDAIYRGPLGTTSHKEYYVLIYSSTVVRFPNHDKWVHIYPQEKLIFERPPIVALMEISSGDRFILIGIHIKPSNAEMELNALSDVFTYATRIYSIQTGFIFGDFNVDYLSHQKIQSLSIYSNQNYHWLLHGVYTNVARRPTSQRKLYDQIVAVGARAMQCYSPGTAKVNEFDNLVPQQHTAWQVSDHYPIEMILQCPRIARWW